MANYIVTDTELTATADSIRGITGDNGSIEWKLGKGFKDELDALAQTSRKITSNGVYDVSNNNLLVVSKSLLGVYAKKGTSSTISSIFGMYGPMGDGANDYLVPVANDSNVSLSISQPYSIQFTFWVTKESEDLTISGAMMPIYLFGGKTNARMPSVWMYAYVNGDELTFYFTVFLQHYDGSSWTQLTHSLEFDTGNGLPVYKPIQVKLVYDGTDVVASISDGTNQDSYTFENVYGGQSESGEIVLGSSTPDNQGSSASDYLSNYDWAYIDIDNCYIKQGSSYLWKPDVIELEEEIVDGDSASEEAGT